MWPCKTSAALQAISLTFGGGSEIARARNVCLRPPGSRVRAEFFPGFISPVSAACRLRISRSPERARTRAQYSLALLHLAARRRSRSELGDLPRRMLMQISICTVSFGSPPFRFAQNGISDRTAQPLPLFCPRSILPTPALPDAELVVHHAGKPAVLLEEERSFQAFILLDRFAGHHAFSFVALVF